jgi:hypothetical protein
MWKLGDRVLARRRPEVYWYPGTIRHSDGQRFYIIFDDDEDGFALPGDMTACQFELEDRIEVYQAASGGYLAARVTQADGPESVRVRYPNKEEQSVPLTKVRVQPDLWKHPDPAQFRWSVTDRVLACWYDLDWYPGIVLAVQHDRLSILFDSGTQAVLPLAKVRPFRIAAGERVMCRRGAGHDYYTGQLAEVDGEKVQVRYDDGSVETTSARLLRLRRDDWFPTGPGSRAMPGARALVQGFDLFWYPARLSVIDGKRIHVRYADGDEGLVTPDQVRPLDIRVGSRVFCRRGGGPHYLPGRVTEQDGDRIHVTYDDLGEETTSVRLVRVE